MRLQHLFAGATLQVVENGAASRDAPEIDQSGGGADVFARQAHGLFNATDRMTDVDTQVPQRVEQPFSKRADERIGRVVAKEDDVDIAVESERGPAVAPYGNERQSSARVLPECLASCVRGAVESVQQTVERSRMRASSENPQVATTHRVLERPAVSTEITTTGLTELWGEAT